MPQAGEPRERPREERIEANGVALNVRDWGGPTGATWEQIARDLAPPDFAGTPKETYLGWMRRSIPGWRPEMDEIALNIVELRPDDTVGPRLSRANHMRILRAMWDEDPQALYM